MSDSRSVTPPVEASAPEPEHCANCMWLPDPITPGDGFWACQNLCIRD